MSAKITKNFDAVEQSRQWKEAVGREVAGMTRTQRLAYFRAGAERYFAERQTRRAADKSAPRVWPHMKPAKIRDKALDFLDEVAKWKAAVRRHEHTAAH